MQSVLGPEVDVHIPCWPKCFLWTRAVFFQATFAWKIVIHLTKTTFYREMQNTLSNNPLGVHR